MFISIASKALSLTGKRFGHLEALGPIDRIVNPNGSTTLLWLCRCDCGAESRVRGEHLRGGSTISCGCERASRLAQGSLNIKHHHYNSPEYRAWCAMKNRCLNPRVRGYHSYGGRGIKVWPAWINDFTAFLSYVGKRPSPTHSLDRFPDMNGNYEPGNVRWATQLEQQNNRRSNLSIEAFGRKQTCAEWAREFGLSPQALWARIFRFGWCAEDALTKPKQRRPARESTQ